MILIEASIAAIHQTHGGFWVLSVCPRRQRWAGD